MREGVQIMNNSGNSETKRIFFTPYNYNAIRGVRYVTAFPNEEEWVKIQSAFEKANKNEENKDKTENLWAQVIITGTYKDKHIAVVKHYKIDKKGKEIEYEKDFMSIRRSEYDKEKYKEDGIEIIKHRHFKEYSDRVKESENNSTNGELCKEREEV
jgi:hypothetical protein